MNNRLFTLTATAFLMLASSSFGQTSKGTIAGVVTDSTGGTISHATVTAKDDVGPENRTVNTNSAGEYRIEAINLSTYTVTVSAPGFATRKIGTVRVEGSVVTTINAQLEVGTVGQSVEVVAAAQTIQAESGDINKTVSTAEVQNLPINSLNPIELARTEPGVTTPASRENFTNGVGFAVNGLRPRENNFLIDGFDNNDSSINGQALQPQNPEAIQEITFLTNAYAPEYGHGGASVTNVIYKSGTNQYHGDAWDRYWAAAMDAIKAEEHQQGFSTVPQFVENTFGFDAGGPLIKNKLFLFGTSQWDINHYDESGNPLTIPTAQGIASLKSLGTNSNVNLLLNSLGSAVGPGGSSSVSTVNIGNRAGCGSPCLIQVSQLIRTPKAISDGYEYVIRGDYTASEKDTFSTRFIGSQNSLTPDLFANGSALPTQDSFQGGPARNLGFFWTHVFSPTKVNEVRFTDQTINFTFGLLGSTLAGPLANTPQITVSGLTNVTFGGPNSALPQGRAHDTFQYQEAFSWNVGHHTFKIGADFVHFGITDQIPFNTRGTISVQPGGDCTAVGLTKCTALANFIDNFTGPSGSAGRSFGSPILAFPQTIQNYYFQDTWKLRPTFTLTYGVRYEFTGTPFNGLPYPAVNPNTVLTDPYPLRVTQQPDKNNFGPRVGLAWTPSVLKSVFGENKTVFRAGFGVFYDDLFTNIEDNTAGTAPNTLGGTLVAPSSGRGSSGLLNLVSSVTPVLNPLSGIDVIPSNIVNPLIYQWNFNIQRQLPGNFLATAAYVGTRGERLYLNNELNPGVGGVRLDPVRGSILSRTNLGNSSYNGLQLDLERRFTKGFLIRGNYTFSKSIDTGSEVFTIQNSSVAQNPFNVGLDRGLSAFDHRHVGSITWVYDLPYAKSNSILNYVTKGWNVSGAMILQSGSPTTVYDQYDTALTLRANERPNLGNPSAAINYSPACLASATCITGVGQVIDTKGTLVDWNTGAPGTFSQFRYIVPLQAAGNFGNLGRNTVENPGTAVWSLAVARSFPIPGLEGHRLQFRAEAFNPFNHANAGDLAGNVNDPNFLNKDVTFNGGREMRLWLFYRF